MDLGVRLLWTGVLLLVVSDAVVITPPKVVVEYGGSTSAVCTTNLTHMGMGWEAPQGPVDTTSDVKSLTWTVDKITEWDISPLCYLIKTNNEQEQENLRVLVYKVPDKVSISLVKKSSGPLVEGTEFELQCRVENVAPVNHMTVLWFEGKNAVSYMKFLNDTTITPKNESRNITLHAERSLNGLEYRCEARLDLGPEGPQPPPAKTSETLRLNINYAPKFLTNVEMFQQMEEEGVVLNCTVEGNPPPSYSWNPPIPGQNNMPVVTLKTAGNYTCTSTNPHGSDHKLFTISPAPTRPIWWVILVVVLALVLVLVVVVLVAGYYVKKKKMCL